MVKVFIDGSAGTTGLNILSRLRARKDISLICLDEDMRKDETARKQAIYESDITFLCLPDDAARQAVAMAGNSDTVIIDTSTAHRVDNGFVYGFAELKGRREKIATSKRIANPGCHASGFISLVAPLNEAGVLNNDCTLSCFSLTGYSGGGKKMIADYENPDNKDLLASPAIYGLSQTHKHLPEMVKISGIQNPPVFCPIVAPFYSGMLVTVTLSIETVNADIEDIKNIYRSYYGGKIVNYSDNAADGAFLYSGSFSGRDDMEISVYGNSDRIVLASRFDNLGKGACGAAIQNMNIVLGLPEETGLILSEE